MADNVSPRPRPPIAIAASAARLKLNERPKLPRPQEWQKEAWRAYDVIGEVKFGINYIANHLAKLRLYPAFVPSDPREAPAPDDSPEGHAALAQLRGISGGYGDILREAGVNLQVAGECFLVGRSSPTDLSDDHIAPLPPPSPELSAHEAQEWDIKSTDELRATADGHYRLREHPGATEEELTDATAFIVRIWYRHARFSLHPDSPLRGVLSSCLAEGSLVYTPKGPVPIEQVEPGTQIWSRGANGELITATVKTALPKGQQRIFRIHTANRSLLATADHPILVLRQVRPKAKTWEVAWVTVGELRRKDLIVTFASGIEKEAQAELPTGESVSTEDAWAFGVFMGDGYFTENGVGFCVEGDVRERIISWAKDRWGARCSVSGGTGEGQGPQTHVNSRVLARSWRELGLHAAAPEKDIPSFVWSWPQKMQEVFIEGYQDSDGHWTKQGWRSYATSSFKMASHLRALHISLGDKVSNLFCEQRKVPIRIPRGRYGDGGGGFMKQTLPLWRFQVYNSKSFRYNIKALQSRGARAAVGSENFSVEKVRSIQPAGETQVWDLDVPGPRNFIAEGIVVHNCEEIERIERAIRAAAKSRAAGPGILLVPEEMSFGNPDPTTDNAGDGEDVGDPFTDALIDAMMTPIKDEGSAAAVVPLVVRGPIDALTAVRRVELTMNVDEKLMTLERAITRLAQGLNLPPEIITGKADLNHWVAWQVSEEVFSAHVEPLAVPIVDSLTTEYYRTFLVASGMSKAEAERRMLWYDPTNIITRPNRSADADFGLEHIALSERAWRKAKNFPEEDAPTKLERLLRLVLQRGSFDPVFTSVLLKELDLTDSTIPTAIDQPPSPQPSKPPAAKPVGPPDLHRPRTNAPPRPRPLTVITASTTSPDGAEIGSRLLDIDRDIRTRLHASADSALARALDRASSIIVSKFRGDDRFSSIMRAAPKLEIASRIGRVAMQAEGVTVESLLESSFDPLADRFADWVRRAYSRAVRVLGLTSSEAPDDLTLDGLSSEAAAWLVSSLKLLATERLFDPSPSADLFGELDDTSAVPFAIIREAIARAGGATPSGIYISPSLEPMGGIATGALILGTLSRLGGGVDGWEWVYGEEVRTREFPPHRDLDGMRFSSWSAEVLTNRQTWPPVTHYVPGDHAGCLCSHMPILSLPSVSVA